MSDNTYPKFYQIFDKDGTWSETSNDHSHDGIKRNGVFYYDDPPEISLLVSDLLTRPRAGASLIRSSIDHIKFGALNYSPSTGTISVDGQGPQRATGFDAFRALVEFTYPKHVRGNRGKSLHVGITTYDADTLH